MSIPLRISRGAARRSFFASSFFFSLVFAAAVFFPRQNAIAEEVEIEIKAQAGIKYDTPRFKVAPGAHVRLTLENTDDMAHNLVLVKPGARMDVVNMTLTMPMTEGQNFIPKTDKILAHTSVLIPGKSETIEFDAPKIEGVYPYVCTVPGHGLVMFGAMYVTTKEMPPFAQDKNLPPTATEPVAGAKVEKPQPLHAFTPQPPYLYRIFVRDSGPASIAVALPHAENFVWDAGWCRLRYVWKGDFLDPRPHWKANGDAFAEVKGRIWWRAPDYFPLRIGDENKIPHVQFLGYRLVDRFPEFHYRIDGVSVYETIKPLHHGGVTQHFAISNAGHPVFFKFDRSGGAKITSSGGELRGGIYELTPEEAGDFTITYTEIPNKEPLLYFSMNDVLPDKVGTTTPEGVRGRAVKFDGKKNALKLDIKASDLKGGATIEFWTRAGKPEEPKSGGGKKSSSPPKPEPPKEQTIFGAKDASGQFTIGYSADGKNFGIASSGATMATAASAGNVEVTASSSATNISTDKIADNQWHHVALVLTPKKTTLFIDGEKQGEAGALALPDAPLTLGAVDGKNFFAGSLDELRIFDRVLGEKELHGIYEHERPKAHAASTEAK